MTTTTAAQEYFEALRLADAAKAEAYAAAKAAYAAARVAYAAQAEWQPYCDGPADAASRARRARQVAGS